MAAVTKLLSLQSGVTRAIQSGDTVAATGAWTFADNAVFNAPVLFNGGATGIISENVLIKDPFTVHASDYQVDADRAAGNVFVTRGSTAFSITSVSANKFLTSADPSATIAANDFISIANPANPLNLGIFEVASVDAAGVTIKTSPDASVAGIVSQAATNSGAGGTLAKARLSVFKADAAGDQMSVAYGSASPLVFQKMLESDDLSMQSAYEGGAATTLAGGVPVSWALSAGGNNFEVQGAGSMLLGTVTELEYLTAAAQYVSFTSSVITQLLSGTTQVSVEPNAFTAAAELVAFQTSSGAGIYSCSEADGLAKQQIYLEHQMAGQSGSTWSPQVGYAPTIKDLVAMSDGASTIRFANANSEREARVLGSVRLPRAGGDYFVATGHGQRMDLIFDAALTSADIGKMAYLSTTNGKATITPPDAAGTHIVELGVVLLTPSGTSGRIMWAPRYVAAN